MFEVIDREEKDFIVLIPGWGFDRRIFSSLDLPYNYFMLRKGEPALNFEKALKKLLKKEGVTKISLFGWSQGAFLACDFAGKNPGIINEVMLVSARRKYEKEGLENIKKYLRKNKKAYLYKFYKECFSRQEADHSARFKREHLLDYLEEMRPEALIEALDRIAGSEIDPRPLEGLPKVKIIHGKEDKIAPLEEAMEIKKALPGARLITFENTGHLPFLREDFRARLNDG